MSKLNEVTSTTNNQSNQPLSARSPFLLTAHDNLKVKNFLYAGTMYTLEELTAIFSLTQLQG